MSADRDHQPPTPLPDRGSDAVEGHRLTALARLSGGMAHDFNNVLHVIKNATDLLRLKLPNPDPDIARLLDMLGRNAEGGRRLTRELLAFAGRQPLAPVPLNANRLIADMQHKARETLGRQLQLETVLGGSLWQVEADSAELEAAILRLIQNARDAMGASGKVTIETANIALGETPAIPARIPAGNYVCIAVRDHGPGIAHEALPRIFEPYFTTKEGTPMAGLGLSRVYGFVTQMRGHVAVESRLGHGTMVKMYLPRYGAADSAGGEREQNVVALGAKSARLGALGLHGLRVLVVEDESLIGMLAEDLLEQLGCRMAGLVSSVGRALDAVKSGEIDFALLDVDIGGEPVYPVALALQARGVPFLFMSGYGGLDGAWQGRPIVQKPFDVDQLKREIERALTEGNPPA